MVFQQEIISFMALRNSLKGNVWSVCKQHIAVFNCHPVRLQQLPIYAAQHPRRTNISLVYLYCLRVGRRINTADEGRFIFSFRHSYVAIIAWLSFLSWQSHSYNRLTFRINKYFEWLLCSERFVGSCEQFRYHRCEYMVTDFTSDTHMQ